MSESINRSETSVVALVLQSIAVVAGVAVLALSPPASGPMLVVPLGSASPLIWLGHRDDVRIVGLGRLAGSIMVLGERDTPSWYLSLSKEGAQTTSVDWALVLLVLSQRD